jgi:hypothetical protein
VSQQADAKCREAAQNGGSGAGWFRVLATLGECPGPGRARTIVVMSQARQEPEPMAGQLPTIEDLAWAQHAVPVADPGELAADIWESDAELAAFLADLRASRNASLA